MRGLRLVQAVVWAGVIFLFSSFSNPPGASGHEWQSDIAHTVEYAVLGLLVWRALEMTGGRRKQWVLAIVAWGVCILYGASDEFHQSFVANRDANVMDVGFDALGAAIGIAAVFAIECLARRRRHPE
jgi:VanZ family protein